MTTKLTLSVKPEIKQLAKKIAKQRGKTISGLISGILKEMDRKNSAGNDVELGTYLVGIAASKKKLKKSEEETLMTMILEKHSKHLKK